MNKKYIFLIVKDKVINSKNRKVNINLEKTNRMDCMFIFKYKHTIDLRDLCLDQNRLIENFLFNKLHRIVKYLFQSYVIKINLINPKIIFNKMKDKSIFVFKNIIDLLKEQFSLDSKIEFKRHKVSLDSKIVFNRMKEKTSYLTSW